MVCSDRRCGVQIRCRHNSATPLYLLPCLVLWHPKKKQGPAIGCGTRRTSSLKWLVRGKETCAVSASMVRSFADPVNECLVVVRRHAVVKEGAGAMVVPG